MIAKSGIKVLDFGLAKSGQDETVTGQPHGDGHAGLHGAGAEGRQTGRCPLGYLFVRLCPLRNADRRASRVPAEAHPVAKAGKNRKPVSGRRPGTPVAIRCRAGAGTGRRHRRRKPRGSACLPPPRLFWRCLAAAYFYFHRAPKLTDKDTIVLADFVNKTGDPVFDDTLRQGLAVQLEQSPFLKIMDDGQVQRVLRLMSLPPGARITNQVAHEICVREGAAATIDGTIASLGKSYVITLQAIACQDGATLAREQIQAVDKEHVLNAVGSAATAMRGKLGEPHNSIQKLNRPLEQATTPSLEALQNYTAGTSEMGQGHFLAAVPLFERAIAHRSEFRDGLLLPWRRVRQCGGHGAQPGILRNRLSRLIDRVSEFERAMHHRILLQWPLASWTKRLTPIDWVSATIPDTGDSITI